MLFSGTAPQTWMILPMIMPEMEVQDIDTEEDWAIAELKFLHMKDGNPAP